MSPRIETILSELGIEREFIAGRGLPECAEAVTLELVETGADGREYLLVPEVAEAWRAMKAAALADGIELRMVSAFRSIDRQAEIVRRKLASGQCIADILCVNAPPGFSEHHTGRAVDIGTSDSLPLATAFEQTGASGARSISVHRTACRWLRHSSRPGLLCGWWIMPRPSVFRCPIPKTTAGVICTNPGTGATMLSERGITEKWK